MAPAKSFVLSAAPMKRALLLLAVAACATPGKAEDPKTPVELVAPLGHKNTRGAEQAVLLQPPKQKTRAIVGATLLLGDGRRIEDGAA